MSAAAARQALEAALRHLQAGQPDTCDHALETIAPADRGESWISIKSAVLALKNNAEQALKLLQQGLTNHPDSLPLRINLGMVQRDQGDLDAAIATFAYVTAAHPQAVEGWLNRGLAQMAARQWDAAAESLYAAAQRAPDRSDIRLAAALALARGGHPEPARAALESTRDPVTGQFPNDALVYRTWMALNDSARARDALAAFLAENPEHAEGWSHRALLEERANLVGAAEASLARISPEHVAIPSAALTRARLLQRRQDYAQALSSLSTQGLDDPDLAVEIMFERARLLDALGRYDEAHAAATTANEGARQLRVGAPGILDGLLATGVDGREPPTWSPPPGDSDAHPVFVIGLPRSGSTLLELMLDGHGALQVLPEEDALERLVSSAEKLTGQPYPACLALLSHEQIQALQLQYFHRAEECLQQQGGRIAGTRLVDKNPLNLLRLPLIHRLFPGAPIVVTDRDLRDTALSCFLHDLGGRGEQGFWSLDESLRILTALRAFMDEQVAAMGLRPHRMLYEDWIRQPDSALEDLCAALGIAFDPNMLDTAATAQRRGAIGTPSYAAVTEPAHTTRIGRWRHYAAYF